MDLNIETNFVRKCIKKEYQERLLFELSSKKHREKALSRLAHASQSILQNNCSPISVSDLRRHISHDLVDGKKCYVISGNQNDGEMLEMRHAIEYFEESSMLVIVIAPSFVVVKEELEKKAPQILIFNLALLV